jgi:mersacidin/lichenicidin family type 2 lantibiotic
MTRKQIIRAWKDAEYRNSLSESERASLPENPAGMIELSDASLNDATGALIRRVGDDSTVWTCTMCLPCFGSTYGFTR